MNNTIALVFLATMAFCWLLMMVIQARVMKVLRESHVASFAQLPAKMLSDTAVSEVSISPFDARRMTCHAPVPSPSR